MGNKYTKFGLQVEKSIGPDARNVRQINLGKKKILENTWYYYNRSYWWYLW